MKYEEAKYLLALLPKIKDDLIFYKNSNQMDKYNITKNAYDAIVEYLYILILIKV